MSSLSTTALVIIGLFLALLVSMNVVVRIRARALKGKPLPELPGGLGASIARARSGLVYFFSPSCAACRTLTPRLRTLAAKNKDVFVIDVTEHLDLARAMRILATPSTVEVAAGQVIDVRVGMLPAELLRRFAS
jgi:thioredoxin 1